MTQLQRLLQDIKIDRVHLCNTCAYRDHGQLQPVEASPHARFVCGISPSADRVMTEDSSGAVTTCNEFSGDCEHPLPQVASNGHSLCDLCGHEWYEREGVTV